VSDIATRAASYDMASEIVDGQDVDAVHDVIARAVARARSGGGPTLIEAKTYRYVGHSRSDKAPYRKEGELDEWLARDPIELFAQKLLASGELSADALAQIRRRQSEYIDHAEEIVLASPASSIRHMFENIFSPSHS
jgi:pyruvate dehydrogenase E1 component alpha subunit